MLMPDNIHPEMSIYYNGYIILSKMNAKGNLGMVELYHELKEENAMSFSIYMLSLDWLFLIQAASIDENGVISKCL